MWTKNFQMYKLDFENVGEPETKLPTSIGSQKKKKLFPQKIYFCFTDYTKAFDYLKTQQQQNRPPVSGSPFLV